MLKKIVALAITAGFLAARPTDPAFYGVCGGFLLLSFLARPLGRWLRANPPEAGRSRLSRGRANFTCVVGTALTTARPARVHRVKSPGEGGVFRVGRIR